MQPIMINLSGNKVCVWPYRIIRGDKIFRTIVVSTLDEMTFSIIDIIFFRAISFKDDEVVVLQIDEIPQKLCLMAEECTKEILSH